MPVEFYRHSLGANEKDAFAAAVDQVFLTTGPLTAQFEKSFASFMGAPHAIGVMSCTHALTLALRGLKVGPGDEVITTPLTFVATANAILQVGAKPVFADVDPSTGLLDIDAVRHRLSARTRAIIPVHLYGAMADMRRLRQLADAHGLKLIEDAAHCVEGSRDGVQPGTLGDAACFSFYATKTLTCGEGGAIVTPHAELAAWLRKARSHGISKDAATRYHGAYNHWDMEFLGYKANLNDLQAALLIPQLPRLKAHQARREAICQRYQDAFASMNGIAFPAVPPESQSARHLFTVWVQDGHRDAIVATLQEQGIGVAVNYRPVHLMQYYRNTYGYVSGNFPNAEAIGAATISLPLYASLQDQDVEAVIGAVRNAIGNRQN